MLPGNVMGVGIHITPVILPAAPLMTPTPGVTMGMHAMAVPPCPTILLTCQPALNMGSIVPVAPNMPPILVPPVMPQENVMGVPTILMMALPATMMTSPAISAGPPGLTSIPDVNTVFYMYAEAALPWSASGHSLATVDDLRAIAHSLDGPMVDSALLAGEVGYVSIRKFSSGIPSSVFHATRVLEARGVGALIIDLRGNPGGEMGALLQLASDFLERGSPLVTMVEPDGDETTFHAQDSATWSFPVAVLVDSHTASAAEIFAGCLQAHRRAIVVGECTYGKAEAQAFVPTPAGLIYATVATFTLPDGRNVHGVGVRPDVPATSADALDVAIGSLQGRRLRTAGSIG